MKICEQKSAPPEPGCGTGGAPTEHAAIWNAAAALGMCVAYRRLWQLVHFSAHLLAEDVDGYQLAFGLDVPECPAVAGRCTLHTGAHLVD